MVPWIQLKKKTLHLLMEADNSNMRLVFHMKINWTRSRPTTSVREKSKSCRSFFCEFISNKVYLRINLKLQRTVCKGLTGPANTPLLVCNTLTRMYVWLVMGVKDSCYLYLILYVILFYLFIYGNATWNGPPSICNLLPGIISQWCLPMSCFIL